MPRANRHFLPSQLWHITHRCNEKAFLFKFVFGLPLRISDMTMQTAVFLGMGLIVLYAAITLVLALWLAKKAEPTKTRPAH